VLKHTPPGGEQSSGDVESIIPCSQTNTFFVQKEHPDLDVEIVVHRVKQDGTELSRWLLDLSRYVINSMSLNSSGSLLAVTSDYEVNFYLTVNGDLVNTEEVTDTS